MKKIISGLLLISSLLSYASDCSVKIESAITGQYPYDIETMTMDVKKLGVANVGHRFENNRYSEEIDVYSAGTSDEGGGILYIASVKAKSCKIISLNKVLQQDD